MNERIPIDHESLFDEYSDSFGEKPMYIVGEKLHEDDRVRRPQDLSIQVGRFGKLRSTVEGYTRRGLRVGVAFAGPRKVRILISEHPDLIKKSATVIGVAAGVAAAGVIYFHEHHKPKK